MEEQAHVFKDDTLNGIFLAIQNLQHQKAETKVNNPDAPYTITKYNPLFRNLINYLDLCFSFGLKDGKKGYWPYVKKIAHSSVSEMVERHRHASDNIKKGYIWLFLTFIENSLEGYMRMMVTNTKLLRLYYKNYALLRDSERCEILFNLLIGLESFHFSINFEDPYLDFGHDPVLRQEKVVIRVHSSPIVNKTLDDSNQGQSSKQPDVTINLPGTKTADYPDLLEAQQNLLLAKPTECSPKSHLLEADVCKPQDLDMDLVENVGVKQPKARDKKSNSTASARTEGSSNGSLELEEDNYIPEIGSPEYALQMKEEVVERKSNQSSDDVKSIESITSDPMIKSFSKNDDYQLFLETYKNEDEPKPIGSGEAEEVFLTHCDEDVEEDLLTPITPVVDKIQKLGLCDAEGYQLTYFSDDDEEEEDYRIERSDSFDRFCRKNSCESSSSSNEGNIPRLNRSASSKVSNKSQLIASLVEITPSKSDDEDQDSPPISQSFVERKRMPSTSSSLFESTPNFSHITRSASISKLAANRMNISRHDTRIGFLLPTLPRRPDYKEAMNRSEEIELDQSEKVLLTLEIFNQPTELPVKMFEVNIGCFVGLRHTMYLLVSTLSVYLLEKRENVTCGYVSMMCIHIDCINKVQTGLNFQDVYISHDDGCVRLSTGDEIKTRSILLTIRSVIKSNSGVGIEKEQPVAANTNNELELIINDWLICHTRVEEPEILHFVLMQFSVLSSHDWKNKIIKSGYAACRHFLVAGVKTSWDEAFFTLRGHTLSKYGSSGTDVKNVYDLSKKCGGCVRSGTDGTRYTFRILGEDGSTPIVELGVDNENEANEWLMTICQVVADAKNGSSGSQSQWTLVNVGLVLTSEKIYFFNQDPKSGRLSLEDSCSISDITQVCVDNENRTYCTLVLDHYGDRDTSIDSSSKITWLLNFNSEYELGKFEMILHDCWEALYQVPLQFVLLSDVALKKKIEMLFNRQEKKTPEISLELLTELINN